MTSVDPVALQITFDFSTKSGTQKSTASVPLDKLQRLQDKINEKLKEALQDQRDSFEHITQQKDDYIKEILETNIGHEEHIQRIVTKHDELNANIGKLNEKTKKLEETIKKLFDDFSEKSKETEALKTRTIELESACLRSLQKHKELQEFCNNLKLEQESLKLKTVVIAANFSESQKQYQDLFKEKVKQQSETILLRERCVNIETQFDELNTQTSLIYEQVNLMEKQIDLMKKESIKVQRVVKRITKENTKLKATVESQKKEIEALREKVQFHQELYEVFIPSPIRSFFEYSCYFFSQVQEKGIRTAIGITA